jgi:hypothetical protein
MTRERKLRMYANHLALMVRGSAGAFKLIEKPGNMRGSEGKQREIGTYRSLDTLERAIKRYNEWMLRDLDLYHPIARRQSLKLSRQESSRARKAEAEPASRSRRAR